ncbi:hypothetical protein ACH5RR_012907 [Cinchona calisaya]|uniref:Dehydrogenase E1 component domain-containing protein n=1 Tax=Cinchona calisaya TaxID=153742 RepID=A0ABD3ABG6_9GENT
MKIGEQIELASSDEDNDENQASDFPGERVAFTPKMNFISQSSGKRIPCYRVLDDDGYNIAGTIYEQVSKEVAVRMYSVMVTLQIMDTISYKMQRQGQIILLSHLKQRRGNQYSICSSISPDNVVLPQYHEPGVLLWHGFFLQEFSNQCFGNKADYRKGRHMPMHYGSQKHNYFTVSSSIATQLPQAAGVAYSLKMDKNDACVVTYIGDGGTTEGDFHDALNFTVIIEVTVTFICHNDGDEDESELHGNIRKQLLQAIQLADKTEKPPLANLFSDVYEDKPPNLQEQEKSLRETIKKHPQDYLSDVPL